MNKKLIDALLSVSNTSSAASELAKQLLVEAGTQEDPVVTELKAKIAQLQTQVSVLTMQLIPEDEEVSDEEAAIFATAFTTRLKDAKEADLLGYTRAVLAKYSRPVRLMVVTVLRNKAVDLEVPVLDLWMDIIALDGEMK